MIRYDVLSTVEEKNARRDGVTEFFARVFQRPLAESDYQHFMVRSPYQGGRCILALDGDRVVGTANLIPQRLRLEGETFPYYLFTTSAVDPQYRRQGVYLGLMRLVVEESKGAGQSFVLAFPNEAALLPLTKLCGFRLIRTASIVSGPLSRLGDLRPMRRAASIALDDGLLGWRFEHRAYFRVRRDELTLICKDYHDATDIVEVLDDAPPGLATRVPEGELKSGEVNLLDSRCTTPIPGRPVTTLTATWRPLRDDIDGSAIDVSLLMWDIV